MTGSERPEPTGPPDPLGRLRAAGLPVDELSGEQRQVLTELADDELALLLAIKARLDALEPEVQAHTGVAGAGLF